MQHPYAGFVQNVEKPARYLGGEFQAVIKDWSTVEAKLCLAFPDIYDIGMSHLGTKILYSLINKHPKLLCERAFTPWVDMERELRARKLPIYSLESTRPLRDFDVVGISLQYELTFTNVLTLLELSRIPRHAVERSLEDPLVIGGGPTATHPEAIAPFFDAFLIGDGEEKLSEILLTWVRVRNETQSREEALAAIARIGGVYVPRFYRTEIDPVHGFEVVVGTTRDDVPAKPMRQVVADLNRYPFPDDSPVAVAEAIFDRMSVEIARGCTEGCRFCQAGMIYRPVRERDPEQIVDTIVSAIQKGGYDEVSLTSLSTADYSCISPLIKKVMERLRAERVSLSVSSLRAYGLDEDLLDEIKTVRATGMTFAPEAGSERMRKVISKNITEEDLSRTAHRIFSRGWSRMKLYFMIGLPTETDEDVVGIIETGARMRQIGLQYIPKKRDLEVVCSVSTHAPKPHTPFQWFAMDSLEEIHRKHKLLESASRKTFVGFKHHEAYGSYLEVILGRADRRVARAVELAYDKGCRFDGWDEHLKFSQWQEALNEAGLDVSLYLNEIPLEARLPWDHLDMQLEPDFLVKEYKKALKHKPSPPCGKAVGDQVHHTNVLDALAALQQKLVCYDCGLACDLVHMKEERIDFLSMLGAFAPPVKKEPAPEAAEVVEIAVPEKKSGGQAEPPKFAQPDAVWYRVAFTKREQAAMSGHLDLVRNFPRIVRRAGFSSNYSQGFHPKPLMTFGPALKLGIESLCEYIDIAVYQEVSAEEMKLRLGAAMPVGMEILGVRRLQPKEHSISRVIAWADYVVTAQLPMSLDLDELSARCTLAGKETMEIVREGRADKREKPRKVNISPFVGYVYLSSANAEKVLDISPDRLVFRMRLRVNAEGNARPEEVLQWLSGGALSVSEIYRVGLWDQNGQNPLLIESLPASASVAVAE